ncbi:MAG TPA: thiamine-phosphate kinase [Bryobacteraceae bacterium]|nr:thiamine-phosphate kinase [Bryobacteraceae bacterium]
MVKQNHGSKSAGEIEFIERLRKKIPPAAGGVALGIGDDCAIFRPRASEELLFTTDLLIEDTHFRRETHGPEDVGWKALARALSDLAAMGAEPRFCLLSLALPPWAGARWVDGFYRGFLRLSAEAGAPLIGGDLGRAEKAMCDVIACGAAPRGRSLRRGGAGAGDAIYVSGALGGSALGLDTGRGRAWRRHAHPEPRLALGQFLRRRGATAAMDLSDGLSIDLRRMALASKLAAEIAAPPVFPGATLHQALHGGEDYELLFTAPARVRIPAAFEGLPLTRLGFMRKGRAGEVHLDGAPLAPLGWDHLRR